MSILENRRSMEATVTLHVRGSGTGISSPKEKRGKYRSYLFPPPTVSRKRGVTVLSRKTKVKSERRTVSWNW